MSNEALKAELAAIERENNELRAEIGVAVGAVGAAETALITTQNNINNALSNASNSLSQSHQRVLQAYAMQQEMDGIYKRLKNMELANKEIRRCNNIKYYDFETYRKVRKIVQGIMDDMDFSMVSFNLIETAVEKERLESPEYWLTALLIAIVAWRSDQKERAYRALDQAMKLNMKKTASFMLVFNLRVGREEAAFKWFDLLLDDELMGSDKSMVLLFFSLLSKTIEDDVSDSARNRVSVYIRNQGEEAVSESSTSRPAAVKRVSAAFRSFADNFDFPYPLTTKYVSTAGYLKSSLALARSNENIIDFISSAINIDEALRNEFLKQYIDEIVEEPCPNEAEVYDEIERNELIIKYQGDKDAAQQAYEAARLHDETKFDIVAEMMDWVYTTEGRAEANPQMRKNMLLLTSSLQQDAGDEYIQFYQSMFKPEASVSIDGYEGSINLAAPENSYGEIETYYHNAAEAEKSEVKNIAAFVTMGVGVVVGVAAAVAITPVMAVVAVAGLAVGAGLLALNSSKKKRIDLKHEQNIRSMKSIFGEIGAEYKQMEASYKEADLLSGKLEDALASL